MSEVHIKPQPEFDSTVVEDESVVGSLGGFSHKRKMANDPKYRLKKLRGTTTSQAMFGLPASLTMREACGV